MGGVAGSGVAAAGVALESFTVFCLGNLLLGVYQAFGMYYRFAAAECASEDFRSKAISLVIAGGVVAAFLGPWNAESARGFWQRRRRLAPTLFWHCWRYLPRC